MLRKQMIYQDVTMSDATWHDAQLCGYQWWGQAWAQQIQNRRKCVYDGEVTGKAEASEDTTISEQEESTSWNGRGYGGDGSHCRNLADQEMA